MAASTKVKLSAQLTRILSLTLVKKATGSNTENATPSPTDTQITIQRVERFTCADVRLFVRMFWRFLGRDGSHDFELFCVLICVQW